MQWCLAVYVDEHDGYALGVKSVFLLFASRVRVCIGTKKQRELIALDTQGTQQLSLIHI